MCTVFLRLCTIWTTKEIILYSYLIESQVREDLLIIVSTEGLYIFYHWKAALKTVQCLLLLSRIKGYCYHLSKFHIYALVGVPVQVRCTRQGSWDWCTGMTQRDGMGREGGEGFRVGNTRTPMADPCQCMAEPLQYCKVISLQLKWINLY